MACFGVTVVCVLTDFELFGIFVQRVISDSLSSEVLISAVHVETRVEEAVAFHENHLFNFSKTWTRLLLEIGEERPDRSRKKVSSAIVHFSGLPQGRFENFCNETSSHRCGP